MDRQMRLAEMNDEFGAARTEPHRFVRTAQKSPYGILNLRNGLASQFKRSQFCFKLDTLVIVKVDVIINELSCFRYFNEFSADIPSKTTLDKGHGRIEKREYQLLNELSWLGQKIEWNSLNGLGCVKSTVTEKDETHEFTRYFITSLTDLDEFSDSVRKHWSIENNLHWCLDVIFKEDASRAKKDNSPLVLNIMCKTTLNLIFQAQYKRISKRRLMFRAALEPSLFLDILFDPSAISPQ